MPIGQEISGQPIADRHGRPYANDCPHCCCKCEGTECCESTAQYLIVSWDAARPTVGSCDGMESDDIRLPLNLLSTSRDGVRFDRDSAACGSGYTARIEDLTGLPGDWIANGGQLPTIQGCGKGPWVLTWTVGYVGWEGVAGYVIAQDGDIGGTWYGRSCCETSSTADVSWSDVDCAPNPGNPNTVGELQVLIQNNRCCDCGGDCVPVCTDYCAEYTQTACLEADEPDCPGCAIYRQCVPDPTRAIFIEPASGLFPDFITYDGDCWQLEEEIGCADAIEENPTYIDARAEDLDALADPDCEAGCI